MAGRRQAAAGHRQRPAAGFFYAAALLAVTAWFLTPLPDLAAGALVDSIPIHEDVRLGRAGAAQAGYNLQNGCRPGRRCVEDIGLGLIDKIGKQTPELRAMIDAYDWHFGVTHQEFINAFAYPGGRIFVTRGLLDATTDDEIAAVLGHEVGHVLHRHSQRRLVQQHLGRLLFDALLVGDGDGQREGFGAELGGLLHRHAHQLSTMSFSRANEYEADHVGFFACAAGSCHTDALQSFFRKLDGGLGATAWDSTHPGTRDRIATLDGMQQSYRERLRTARGTQSSVSGASSSAAALAELTPPGLAGGGQGYGTGSLLSLASFTWSLLPAEAQRAMFVGALWQAAAALESLWQQFEEGPPNELRSSRPRGRSTSSHDRNRGWAQPRYPPVD